MPEELEHKPSVVDLLDDKPTEAPDTHSSAPVVPSFDPTALAREFGTVLKEHLPPHVQAETQPKLTPEEAKKVLNLWEANPEFLQRFGNPETQLAAIHEMRDGLTKQFWTIMQHALAEREEALRKDYDAKYEPVMTAYQRQQEEAGAAAFGTAYPQLANPALRPVIDAVANNLKAEGKTFKSQAEVFAALAKGVEAVIQVTTPGFKLGEGGGKTAAPSKTGTPGIPVTTPGGGGGGHSSGGDAKPKNKALSILTS